MTQLTKLGRDYIERRGWHPNDYKAIGAYSDDEFVYFPLLDYNDAPVGVIGRNIVYKTYNIKIHKPVCGYFLWRGVDSNRVLFLVEGVFDVGWLLQAGLHAAAYINNTLLGAQLRIVSRFYERVVIIPDNDPEGLFGAGVAVKRLRKMGVPHVKEFNLKYFKDVSETFERNSQIASNLVQVLKRIERSWDENPPDPLMVKPDSDE